MRCLYGLFVRLTEKIAVYFIYFIDSSPSILQERQQFPTNTIVTLQNYATYSYKPHPLSLLPLMHVAPTSPFSHSTHPSPILHFSPTNYPPLGPPPRPTRGSPSIGVDATPNENQKRVALSHLYDPRHVGDPSRQRRASLPAAAPETICPLPSSSPVFCFSYHVYYKVGWLLLG